MNYYIIISTYSDYYNSFEFYNDYHSFHDLNSDIMPRFTMYNDKMENICDFDFKFDFIKNQIIKIHFNYKNNTVLIFTVNRIFQLKLDTRQIITIYDISSYINFTKESSLQSLANKIKIAYYYNRTNNKIEEKIFILNDEINQVCLFDWKDKTLVFNNKNIYPNLYDFIAFYPVDILHLLNNKEMFELKILFLKLINFHSLHL